MEGDHESWLIPPDINKAMSYYKKAEKYEFPRAFNNLGLHLLKKHTDHIEESDGNQISAFNFFNKATMLGDVKSLFNLGNN